MTLPEWLVAIALFAAGIALLVCGTITNARRRRRRLSARWASFYDRQGR